MLRVVFTVILFISALPVFAQVETLTNKTVIEMTRSGLSAEIILRKIGSSKSNFDTSAASLITLKNAGVDDAVLAAMMERNEVALPGEPEKAAPPNSSSESGPPPALTRQEAVSAAKTIALGKSSLQPSRQALEKELMKRKEFQDLNITILRYKDTADLFVDIGYVSGSWITHRYVYRIYDRRSGAVITAGETTSWGSLAHNLARHIARSLAAARAGNLA